MTEAELHIPTPNTKLTIGLLVFDGVEELDFVGPWEAFQMVNEVSEHFGHPAPLTNLLISKTGADVTAAKRMRVGADHSIGNHPPLDVILIPGGQGVRRLLDNDEMLDWIRQSAQSAHWVTSVCTGSMLLAKAGLTIGRRITTHHHNFEEFSERDLPGKLIAGERWVSDGTLVTASGVSAGIDMALWLVGQWFDEKMARITASAMQYEPQPPYGI